MTLKEIWTNEKNLLKCYFQKSSHSKLIYQLAQNQNKILKLNLNLSFSFAVVAEPEAGDEDCEDIGYAWVNVHDILESNNDFIDKKLDSKTFFVIKFLNLWN